VSTIRPVTIGSRRVGPGERVYIVAELSANHAGSFETAVRLVEEAAAAGVDAVKLQTFTADTLTLDSDAPPFRVATGTVWDGRTLYDIYREGSTPWEWHPKLRDVATARGIDLFSAPFDPTAVDFLDAMGVPAFKVASPELVDLPLLRNVAGRGRPVILSTGMATLAEIEEAVRAVREAGCEDLVLLKCTTAYPADPALMNLRTLPDLAARFGCPVGLSDHSMGVAVPVAATALGACLLEKHVVLSRSSGALDAAFSLEPAELRTLVEAVRAAEAALGTVCYEPPPGERENRIYRRSLFVVKPVAAGEPFTRDNVRSIRPAAGLHPRHQDEILGRPATRDILAGTPLSWDLVRREG